jgi:hypothetical protein
MLALFKFVITTARMGVAVLVRESIFREGSIIGDGLGGGDLRSSTCHGELAILDNGHSAGPGSDIGISPAFRVVQSSPLHQSPRVFR